MRTYMITAAKRLPQRANRTRPGSPQKHKAMAWKGIALLLLLLVVITAARLLWFQYSQTLVDREGPVITQGVLDLRDYTLSEQQTMQLDGEWAFYPNQLLQGEETLSPAPAYVTVPGTWEGIMDETSRKDKLRSGSYRLLILLDPDLHDSLAMRIQEVTESARIYVNGKLVASSGVPSNDPAAFVARKAPLTVKLLPEHGQIEVVIQAAAMDEVGGVTHTIRFGTGDAVNRYNLMMISVQLLVAVVILVHSVYALILSLLQARGRSMFYFFLLMVFALFGVLLDDDKLLLLLFDIDQLWLSRFTYFAYAGTFVWLFLLCHSMFREYLSPKWPKRVIGLFVVVTLIVLCTSREYVGLWLGLGYVIVLVSLLLSAVILARAYRKEQGFWLLLGTCICLFANTAWGSLHYFSDLIIMLYPGDQIMAIVLFSTFWFKRYFQATSSAQELASQLQAEEKNKDEFLINTSHELRNPLHGIINISQLLLDDRDHPLQAEQRKRVELQLQVSRRLTLLLDDLLDVTRLKENTVRLVRSDVSLPVVATSVMEMAQLMLDGKPVRIKMDMPESLPRVDADENRLTQILFNLVHNAVKFTDEGQIVVRAYQTGEQVRIEVEDTGIGIPTAEQVRIFEPYAQAKNNAERASGGFGIGLSICRQLVTLHGGELQLFSDRGAGSMFAFSLPCWSGRADEQGAVGSMILEPWQGSDSDQPDRPPITLAVHEQAAAVEWLADGEASSEEGADEHEDEQAVIHLLLIDDDSINLRILHDVLRSEQYKVSTAIGGEQALAIVERESVDLIICDIMMPGMSGYRFTELLRKRYPRLDLPVLLLTARGSTTDIVNGFEAGANDFIRKPVDARVLKARVRALTDLKRSFEERLRLEGAWMQAQIQPHFVFNTLSSIGALGLIDFTKMQALLEQFSNYLRLSFDFHNAKSTVSLDHELDLVRAYLYIEKERFGDSLQIEWEVEPNLHFMLPPLSIQPLAENAIKHGLMKRIGGGTLRIRIASDDSGYLVEVSDNGKGMDAKTCQSLLEPDRISKPRSGVGLLNIERRLKQHYRTGLIIDSSPDQGTCVSFRLPGLR